MKMQKKNLLTPSEITFILIGSMVDVTVVSLPNAVTVVAKQDGWISVIIGAVYPLYVALIAIYMSGKFPKENILAISKKYLGKVMGNILNFLFLLSFFTYLPSVISFIGVIIRTDAVPLLTPLKIYSVLLLLGAYTANKGIKVLGRICSISFLIVLVIMIPAISILKQGSYLNASPVFGTGIFNILKASEASIYDYSCIELIFLIYPFINDSRKIKSSVLKAVGITCILYTILTYTTIYYMGTAIIQKTVWSFFTVTEGIKIEVINNFRYIFVFFWILIAMKSTALFYYAGMFIMEDIKKIKNKEIVYTIISVLIISITMIFYTDILARKQIIQYTSRLSIIYNLIYITFIALLICIKKGGKK